MSLFKRKNKYKSGMTLVELMVVLGIIAIMFGITIFDYSSFRSSVSLNNLANDISLSIRKAQSYSIGARRVNGDFFKGYGVDFSTDRKDSFIIFADVNKDKDYDTSPLECNYDDIGIGNECLEKLTITTGDFIEGFIENCDSSSEIKNGDLDITFLRPNPDANFKGVISSGNQVGVVISNDDNNKKIICITRTGQISVNNYE